MEHTTEQWSGFQDDRDKAVHFMIQHHLHYKPRVSATCNPINAHQHDAEIQPVDQSKETEYGDGTHAQDKD